MVGAAVRLEGHGEDAGGALDEGLGLGLLEGRELVVLDHVGVDLLVHVLLVAEGPAVARCGSAARPRARPWARC